MRRNTMRAGRLAALALGLVVAAAPTAGWALDKEVIKEKPKSEADKHGQGWSGDLRIGATLNLSSNNNVVGKPDGTLFTVGLELDGNLYYINGDHEWRTNMYLGEMFSKSPNIDDFVKTTDKLVIDSIYLYHIQSIPWLGPFARFGLDTALLPGYDVQASPVDYIDDSTKATLTSNADKYRTTDAFKPLQLKESLGVFAKPISEKPYTIEARLGVGARQIWADGQWAIKSTTAASGATRAQVALKPLETYQQVGGELGVYFNGEIWDGKVAYKASAETLMPFYSSGESDKSLVELTNVEFNGGLSFRLVSWLSIEYGLKVAYMPKLLDD